MEDGQGRDMVRVSRMAPISLGAHGDYGYRRLGRDRPRRCDQRPGQHARDLRTVPREMTEPAPLFVAAFDGQPPQQFPTLQAAMYWAEGLESPAGLCRVSFPRCH